LFARLRVFVITQVTGRVEKRVEMGEEADIQQLKLGTSGENKASAAVGTKTLRA
jgi:hypothetical protein